MTIPESTRKDRRKPADKSPAFQLYTKDLLSDGNVMAMDLPQFGAYVKLLLLCWNEYGLLDDLDRMSRQLNTTRDYFDQLWTGIAPCFYLENGRWQQKRLDEERRKQAKYRRAMQLNGRKGGRRGKAAVKPQLSDGLAAVKPLANSSSLSSSSSAIAFASSEEKREPTPARKTHGPGAGAGSYPADHLNCRPPCIRVCVSEKQHAILRARHGGTDAEMEAFYAEVRGNLHGPVGQRPWQFWEEQFGAKFGGAVLTPKTAGNAAVGVRFVARGQQ